MTDPIAVPPGPDISPRTLLDTATRIGSSVWLEQRAFEVLSAWSRDDADPAAQVLHATQARHHAWRAEQLAARFPAIADLALDDRLDPPDPGVEALFDALAALDRAATTDRLVGAHRVLLPELLAVHELDLARATEVAEAPLRRTLRQLVTDEADDLAAGEAALQVRLDADPDADGAAGALVARLTALLDGGRTA